MDVNSVYARTRRFRCWALSRNGLVILYGRSVRIVCVCAVYASIGMIKLVSDNIGTVERIFVKSACDKMHFQSKLRVCKKVTLRTNPYYTFNCAESRCIYFGAVLKNRRNFTLPMKMKTRLLLTVEALQC